MAFIERYLHTARILTLLTTMVSAAPIAAANIEPLDRIIAVVNEDVITESELQREVYAIQLQLRERSTRLPPQDVFQRQVLERLIVERLQLQRAAATGLRVDDDTLNQAVRRIAKNNNLSLTEFREVLEEDGLRFEEFRETLRNEITISRLRTREVDNRITVTPQEIDNFLASEEMRGAARDRQFHLLHILVSVPDAASPEQIQAARAKATDTLSEIRTGADFRETAIAKSDGQQALEGGDLGWRTLGQIPSLFVDVVRKMDTGATSDLIRSPSGFHIILLEEARGGDEQRVITQTSVRHILIRTDEMTSDDEAVIQLEQIKRRIEAGEDFASLARSHSDDKASAINGGDLGWVSPGAMVPKFEEVMDRVRRREVSEPFQSQFGWHILQVMGRREHDSTEEFRRTKAQEQIRKRKIEEELELWLRRLRDEAYVEYRLKE